MQSFKCGYLTDFDALIKGEPLTNEQMVLEHMTFLFLRAIDAFENDYQSICQLLATILSKGIPAIEPCGRFLDQY